MWRMQNSPIREPVPSSLYAVYSTKGVQPPLFPFPLQLTPSNSPFSVPLSEL